MPSSLPTTAKKFPVPGDEGFAFAATAVVLNGQGADCKRLYVEVHQTHCSGGL
jgi:hypothetical protein